MPESKKLSELISDLILTYISRQSSKNINDFEEKTFQALAIKQEIDKYERTIDQKFEELRCDYVKDTGRLIKPVGEALIKQYNEDKEKKKWSDIEEIVNNRIRSEFEKHFGSGDWITYATKKIISSLKEYESNTSQN